MPCSDSFSQPPWVNGCETYLNQIAYLLDEVLLGKPLPSNFRHAEHKDIYDKEVDADYLTSRLCKLCKNIDVSVYSKELQEWWSEHKAIDEARAAKESAIEKEVLEDLEGIRYQALAKLTPSERAILGLT